MSKKNDQGSGLMIESIKNMIIFVLIAIFSLARADCQDFSYEGKEIWHPKWCAEFPSIFGGPWNMDLTAYCDGSVLSVDPMGAGFSKDPLSVRDGIEYFCDGNTYYLPGCFDCFLRGYPEGCHYVNQETGCYNTSDFKINHLEKLQEKIPDNKKAWRVYDCVKHPEIHGYPYIHYEIFCDGSIITYSPYRSTISDLAGIKDLDDGYTYYEPGAYECDPKRRSHKERCIYQGWDLGYFRW